MAMTGTGLNSGGFVFACGTVRLGREAFCYLIAGLMGASLHAQTPGSVVMLHNLPPGVTNASLIDTAGNVFIGSSSAPGSGQLDVTSGAAQTQPGGGNCPGNGAIPVPRPCLDAYLAKVDPAGKVVYATLLGGPTDDSASATAVDAAGNLYVTGTTGGAFPTTPNAAIAASSAAITFAAKLSADGSRFLYATYLPASVAIAYAITVDNQGNAYIAGKTTNNHAVVVKLSDDGSMILYTKVLGGGKQETATSVETRRATC